MNFYSFDSDKDPTAYQRGFAVTIPTCRECLKGAVRVAISIPEVAAKK